MPIHIDFFHPSRLVIAVVRGAITAEDVRESVQQFLASDVLHYRKIIDIASPTAPLDSAAVHMLAELVLSRAVSRPRGALAFVVSPGQAADNASTFAQLTSAERPVKVFHSLHAARKWLDEHPIA
ncbi:STAS/SEC14 domain-containing protein [Reyranella aquatilis]|uniref:STAS/SEC14 domain-containing protein n=1 Tax=Reyranella aquatilis TaxID=2035356 RepID=A0ABS8KR99_9HYPH|nr:STAS/SEC14 domain-containing protein [Reyranella aquatilis]MCC8428593.1 STAS/SEC14 domain-containing protein [Reyranella aquatilis]